MNNQTPERLSLRLYELLAAPGTPNAIITQMGAVAFGVNDPDVVAMRGTGSNDVEPITPEDAVFRGVDTVNDAVTTGMNNLIKEKFDGVQSVLTTQDICSVTKPRLNPKLIPKILDVYRRLGWVIREEVVGGLSHGRTVRVSSLYEPSWVFRRPPAVENPSID